MSTLYQLRMNNGLSQQEVADMLQMSRVNYTNIENGKRNLTKDNALRLAKLFNVSVDTLFGQSDDLPAPAEFSPKRAIAIRPAAETCKVPLVGTFRCGYSRNGEEFLQYDELEVLPSFYDRFGDNLVAYVAIGNSMAPTIEPGDLMFAVLGDAWTDNDIVALVIDDAEMIKRIRHAEDGGLDIIPDNDLFRTVHLTQREIIEQHVAVLARIVKIERYV